MQKPEMKATYYVPCIVGVQGKNYVERRWDGDEYDNMLLKRGVVCATAEAAEILFERLVFEAQSQSMCCVFE